MLRSAPHVWVTSASPHAIEDQPPAGRVLAEINLQGAGYAVAQSDAGYTIRFYSTCEFTVDPALERVQVHRSPACSDELAALLLEGPVLSTLLTLKGHCVVHASAVQLGNRNLGFIGPSGHGKSTLAAALCNVGARLISDDALRCDTQDGRTVCFPATRHVRLRPAARPLAATETSCLLTVDGRLALSPNLAEQGTHPLHALFAPKCVDRGERLTTQRLSGVDVLTHLAASARIACWQSPEMRSKQFSMLAALARSVPVFSLATPRDAVFTATGRQELADALASVKLDAP